MANKELNSQRCAGEWQRPFPRLLLSTKLFLTWKPQSAGTTGQTVVILSSLGQWPATSDGAQDAAGGPEERSEDICLRLNVCCGCSGHQHYLGRDLSKKYNHVKEF